MQREVTDEKLKKYFSVTGKALEMARNAEKRQDMLSEADDFLDMASRCFSDAGHFRDKGDAVLAFAALNYAHGWLDAGARLQLFKVSDATLFTVDED